MKQTTRITAEELERLAFTHPGASIEIDATDGTAHLSVAGVHYVAHLPQPKPDEPTGLGAVVEDQGGVRWVRTDDMARSWLSENTLDLWSKYADITVVRVLSEGVQR